MTDAPSGILEQLKTFVEDESFSRFAGLPDLRFKAWRTREGEWFEGTYVFRTAQAREAFQADFEKSAHEVPGTTMIGSVPILIEPFEVVAVVRGPAGFRSSARFED
ncbi:hypothetical protein [Aeromicrobium sp. Root495]|uniref:hypothetical protein n=1 Tax=Aeromicrobium sp. Root495 TaxID=1736550 RepID=UPI001F245EA7|nr:hypothetical protein [Aeromicrobium sp. Root495]